MKRTLLSFFLCVLFTSIGHGQGGQRTAEDLTITNKTSSADVSHYTGKPNISLPFRSISQGSITLPIGLEYDASGVKVATQRGGLVGINWNLIAGGALERRVRGRADDAKNPATANALYPGYMRVANYCAQNPGGIMCQVNRAIWDNISTSTSCSNDVYRFLRAHWVTESRDGAPDEFSYNIGGRSGKFFFSEEGELIATDKIKVEYLFGYYFDAQITNSNPDPTIVSWTITLSDGLRLVFGRPEVTHFTVVHDNGWPVSASGTSRVVNKWFITQIIEPCVKDPITFNYTTTLDEHETSFSDDSSAEFAGLNNPNSTTWNCQSFSNNYLNTYAEDVLIASVRTKTQNVTFDYTNIGRHSGSRLREVTFQKPDGTVTKKYQLSYQDISHFSSTKRWLLTTVQESDYSGTLWVGKHRFEYNSLNIPYFNYAPRFPNEAGVDHWGYFNGIQPTYYSLIPTVPFTDQSYDGSMAYPTIASRTPNPSTMLAMSLRKWWLPMGGFIEYEFEPHDYSYLSDGTVKASRITAGGLRIRSIRQHDGRNIANDLVLDYEYTSATDVSLSSGVIEFEPNYNYQYANTYLQNNTPAFTIRLHKPVSLLPIEIGYSRVTESRNDGSRTVYQFTTSKDYPRSLAPLTGGGAYVVVWPSVQLNSCGLPVQRVNHPFVPYEGRYDYMRGLLVSKELYKADGSPVYKENHTYQPQEIGHAPAWGQVVFSRKATPVLFVIFTRLYPVSLGKPRLIRSINHIYDMHSGRSLTTTREFEYNALNDQAQQIKTTVSTGDQITVRLYYAVDYINSAMSGAIGLMKYNNMLVQPVEIRNYRNGKLTSGEIIEYDIQGKGLPVKQYVLRTNIPIATLDFNPANHLSNGAFYQENNSWSYSPNLYTLLSQHKLSGPYTSTLWGGNGALAIATLQGPDLLEDRQTTYNYGTSSTIVSGDTTLLPIAVDEECELNFHLNLRRTETNKYGKAPLRLRIVNTDNDAVIYQYEVRLDAVNGYHETSISFPPGSYALVCTYPNTGGTYTSPIEVNARVDKIIVRRTAFHTSFEDEVTAFRGQGRTGTRAHQGEYKVLLSPREGTYRLSYWVRSLSGGNWQYREEIVTVPGASDRIIGSANMLLDEVRLHPLNAQMTTYTYDAAFGKTSVMGPTGLVTYYEYDPLGRPKLSRDDKGNIFKAYEYHIAPQ